MLNILTKSLHKSPIDLIKSKFPYYKINEDTEIQDALINEDEGYLWILFRTDSCMSIPRMNFSQIVHVGIIYKNHVQANNYIIEETANEPFLEVCYRLF